MRNKFYLSVLIFAGFSCPAFSQLDSTDSKKIIYGVSFNTFYSGSTYGLQYCSDFTAEKGRSLFEMGIICGQKFLVRSDGGIYNKSKSFEVHGIHLGYRIFPNPKGKVFDLYFEFDSNAFHYTANGFSYLQWFTNETVRLQKTEIENIVGYGVHARFCKNFFVSTDCGLGVMYSDTNYIREDNSSYRDKYWQLDIQFKLAVGYKFDYKK